MTVTVKLDRVLEEQLRRRASATGATASAVIRAALQAYLGKALPEPASACQLGAGLFGRHHGSSDLASNRKDALTEIWGERRGRGRP